MKKICALFIAVILLAGFATYVESGIISSDGYELLDTCSYVSDDMSGLDKIERIKGINCVGLMAGISITNKSEQDLGNNKLFFCIPDYIANSDLAETLVKYLNKHPDDLHKTVDDLIFTAFRKAFPCKPPKK